MTRILSRLTDPDGAGLRLLTSSMLLVLVVFAVHHPWPLVLVEATVSGLVAMGAIVALVPLVPELRQKLGSFIETQRRARDSD